MRETVGFVYSPARRLTTRNGLISARVVSDRLKNMSLYHQANGTAPVSLVSLTLVLLPSTIQLIA